MQTEIYFITDDAYINHVDGLLQPLEYTDFEAVSCFFASLTHEKILVDGFGIRNKVLASINHKMSVYDNLSNIEFWDKKMNSAGIHVGFRRGEGYVFSPVPVVISCHNQMEGSPLMILIEWESIMLMTNIFPKNES